MIETGINSIVTIDRTDTLYDYDVNNPAALSEDAKRCDVPSANSGHASKLFHTAKIPAFLAPFHA